MYGPGSAPTGAFCLHQITIPRFQTLKMILAGDCVPFLMKLCCSCGRIVKKMCQKEVKKSCRKKNFLQPIAHLGLLTLRRLYSAL